MKRANIQKIGVWLLCLGIMMLITGILLAFTIDTALSPIMLSGSILVNSAGITMLRRRENPERREEQ